MNPAPPAWVNGDFVKPPTFSWGSRIANAPPNIPFPTYFNVNATQDVSISLTKVMGRHTIKAGFYNTHSYKAEQAHRRRLLRLAELPAGCRRHEPVRHVVRLRERGHRLVQLVQPGVELHRRQLRLRQPRGLHPGQLEGQQPADARLRHALRARDAAVRQARPGQQLPARPSGRSSQAPVLYRPGCAVTVAPGTACPAASQQAMNPLTGQLLGPNSTLAIGTLVPGSGNPTNGLFLGGQGIVDTTYTFPALALAPRFGMAYRPDRQAEHGAARRRRALLRSPVRQLGHLHAGQSAVGEERHRPLQPAAEPRRRRPDDAGRAGAEHDRSTTPSCRRRRSGTPACR